MAAKRAWAWRRSARFSSKAATISAGGRRWTSPLSPSTTMALPAARAVGDAFERGDQRQPHGARHDGDMAGRGRVFQRQTQQFFASIIQQLGGPHVARHQDGVARQVFQPRWPSPVRWRSSRRARSSRSCARSRSNGSPRRCTRRRVSSCTRSTAASAVRPVRTASRMRWRQPWS